MKETQTLRNRSSESVRPPIRNEDGEPRRSIIRPSHVDTRGQTHRGAQALSAGSKLRKVALEAQKVKGRVELSKLTKLNAIA